MATDETERQTGAFYYLLNAMENAAAQDRPADHFYALKRAAVFEHVAKLASEQASLRELVARIKSEAQWGLQNSQGHSANCNARKVLKIIIELLADRVTKEGK